MVHIFVGEEQKDFLVHKQLICNYSPCFDAAFNQDFEEAKTGIMKLPKISVEICELFLGWLYTMSLWDSSAKLEEWPKTSDLMKLYVFADVAKIPSLKNLCIDAISQISDVEGQFPIASIAYVYQNTIKGSPIRRFIVDSLAWEYSPDAFFEMADYLTPEIRLEAMVAMRKVICCYSAKTPGKAKKLVSPLADTSNYHEVDVKVEVKTIAKDTGKGAPVKALLETFSPNTESPILVSTGLTISLATTTFSPLNKSSNAGSASSCISPCITLPTSPPFEPIPHLVRTASQTSAKPEDLADTAMEDIETEANAETEDTAEMEQTARRETGKSVRWRLRKQTGYY